MLGVLLGDHNQANALYHVSSWTANKSNELRYEDARVQHLKFATCHRICYSPAMCRCCGGSQEEESRCVAGRATWPSNRRILN